MLAKLSVFLKTTILSLVLFFLLISFTSDFSNSKSPISEWIPSSDKESTDKTEKQSKESATASHLHIPAETATALIQNAPPTASPVPPSGPVLKEGNPTLLEMAPAYVQAIMNSEDTSFPRLDCPVPNDHRYHHLKTNSTDTSHESTTTSSPKYFFALNLHQHASILPRLFGSIVESMRFLGPQDCALSVIEGRSDDGTFEILLSLREEIECMGAKYYFNSSNIDPPAGDRINAGDRIKALAELRNQALQPLVDHYQKGTSTDDTTIVFLNDVAICSEDVLELIHQRHYQNADMVCGMDWTYVGPDPTFYDVWIARGMNGDTFFEIPEDGNWNSAWNIFWNNPIAQECIWVGKPFQVFSCWNGATVFTAKPFLESKIRFRSAHEHECPQGEPKTWCIEMWHLGYGKIAVVPIVNIEYSDEAATKIKEAKGYVSNWMGAGGESDARIEWESTPPQAVKCMPSYQNQTWVLWEEQLGEQDSAPRGVDLV
ncbi:MAG: hypothetical protein ALECFALPRED_008176 [Alectoria fallacina]|uniref:Alpha-1,3-mannosyltransferase CMT1 n=1 Tax=Alectoria fallacina TaxID=1903189 RepID=A0A8H3J2L4_9LECA|nr:MAG: hypothetical protein ALECFALPRED_008176 [Alectoria fallacina]